MDFDQTWYILSPSENLKPYWFSRHWVKFLPRNILVNTRINILQWILTKLGTYLVLRRIWNPIDFQGQRSRSPGQIFRWGDMPRFALLLFCIYFFHSGMLNLHFEKDYFSWQEQVTFGWNDGDICFVLDQYAELDF